METTARVEEGGLGFSVDLLGVDRVEDQQQIQVQRPEVGRMYHGNEWFTSRTKSSNISG